MGTETNIPQKPRRRHTSEKPDPAMVRRLYDEDGKSYREIADLLHSNYAAVYRAYHAAPSNGAPLSAPESAPLVPIVKDDALDRREVIGEPMGAPDSALESAPRLHALEARVSVLEAFIATLQRQPAHLIGAPAGALRSAPTPATKKRGFVIACDLSDALDHYAEMSGLQVRDILDMALRRYLADVAGEEVHRD